MGRRGIGSRGAGSVTNSPATSRSGSRAAPKKPGHGATYSVIVMTAASLFGVAVLAAQAAATAPKVSASTVAKTGGATSTSQVKGGSSGAGASSTRPSGTALPANSGSGLRIVYGEAAKRVWLVSASNAVARTFIVVPGTVAAPTGTFAVTNRLGSAQGTDGTPIQYVVLFNKARVGGSSTAFGFDTVANVTGMPPAPTSRTGGIRMSQADAQALWNFSNFDTTVVVVP